jgi:hypothetical protein
MLASTDEAGDGDLCPGFEQCHLAYLCGCFFWMGGDWLMVLYARQALGQGSWRSDTQGAVRCDSVGNMW